MKYVLLLKTNGDGLHDFGMRVASVRFSTLDAAQEAVKFFDAKEWVIIVDEEQKQ